ncbi:antirestriction protein ArdC [Pantoea agglomerans]|uniref:ArdC family protein n=1 Tax=Enterobacter agglomerans TaxID=549 RepID=UPI0015F9E9A0|nr:zincin-like metallopeptidase domain-containing protein [Pantoea agglomerans]MBA8867027.1 antirestriction protein ArdC [Pantoea agglomerans]MBA8894214.1 antirestriction protein ArdC [Pantoea agglomerans]
MKKPTKARRAKKTETVDLYQKVTDRIVEALEKGVAPWKKPWRTTQKYAAAGPLPVNASTGRAYSGVNVLLLWLEAEEKGYKTDRWVTYKQAQDMGGQVRKGETCAQAVIFKPFEKQAEDLSGNPRFDAEGNPLMESRVMIKPNFLFNVDQCDGLPESAADIPHASPDEDEQGKLHWPTEQRILELLDAAGVAISIRLQDRAYYSPATDRIVMPEAKQFFTEVDYWSTLLHEMVHASGHEKRLSRQGITQSSRKFGDPVYAFEELIAEMGSAFLCAQLGVYGEVQHESYIDSWLKVLKEDKKALFRACRHAREASDFLLQSSEKAAQAA